MTMSVSAVIRFTAASAIAALVLGFATLSVAHASPSTTKPLPNPCKSFTAKSADALFAVRRGTHLSEKLTKQVHGKYVARLCTVRHRKHTLIVSTFRVNPGSGGPLKCYKRPKLGTDGEVCVSIFKQFPGSFARFKKHGVFFTDDYNVTLPHKAARLYAFALAQYKAYKG